MNKVYFLLSCAFSALLILSPPAFSAGTDVTFIPSIDIRGEFDDNVTYSRIDEREDSLMSIKPAFILEYATELFELQSEAALNILRYYDETRLDTEDQYYRINAAYAIMERASLSGNAAYLKDTTLESELEETGLVNFRDERKRYTGGAEVSYQLSELTNVGVNYSHIKTNYDSPEHLDYDFDSLSLSINYQFNNQRDVFTIQPYYSWWDSDASKVDNYGLSLGIFHAFSETTTLTAFAGARYTKTEFIDPLMVIFRQGDETEHNWAGVADINLERKGETYSTSVGYNHDLSYSSDGEPITIQRFYCHLNKRILHRLRANFSGSLIYSKSEGDVDSKDSRYYHLTPSLNYDITENHSLILAYAYSQSYDKSVSTNQRRDRNRVWVALRFEFPKKM